MATDSMEVVLIKKSGPVQTLNFRTWWIYLLLLVLLLMVLGLVVGTVVFTSQHKALKALTQDTHLLILRTERLEAMVHEQQTRAALTGKPNNHQAAAAKRQPAKPVKPPEKAKPAPKPAEPKPAPPAAQSEVKPGPEAPAAAALAGTSHTLDEPTVSDDIEIKGIEVRKGRKKLRINFKVTNKNPPNDKAVGFTTVIARGQRLGKPWIESWPRMRLTPLGRPVNHRRGMPFSVQYRRPMKASFDINDKQFKRLEFVVYSRDGKLMLVRTLGLNPDGSVIEPKAGGRSGR